MAVPTRYVSDWKDAPTKPDLFTKDVNERDIAIQQFIDDLKKHTQSNDKALEAFVYAVSAVIADQFKDTNPDDKRNDLSADLSTLASSTPSVMESYRKQAVDFLRQSIGLQPSSPITKEQVAVLYQLENGLHRVPGDEKTYMDRLQKHISDNLVKDAGPAMPADDFVHDLVYLYRNGSLNAYNHTMKLFNPIRILKRKDPTLEEEWELLKAFPDERSRSTQAYMASLPLLDQAVKAFYDKRNGTNNSVPALTPPAAQPPANPQPAPAAAPVPVNAAQPAPSLTPEQQAIRATMDDLKRKVDAELSRVQNFSSKLTRYGTELKSLQRKSLEAAQELQGRINAEAKYSADTSLLRRMEAQVTDNATIQAALTPPMADQQPVLQKIYDDAKAIYDDAKSGIRKQETEANALLDQLKIDAATAVNTAGKARLDSIVQGLSLSRDKARGEAKSAQAIRDQAEAEYKSLPADVQYQSKAKLLSEKKQFEQHISDIQAKSAAIDAERATWARRFKNLQNIEAANPVWWVSHGPGAMAQAQALKQEIDDFRAEVAKYQNEVEAFLLDVEKTRLGPEASKPAFPSTHPDPTKYKDQRYDQANVWYSMFDPVRLKRSEDYRLDLIKNKKATPWPFSFDSVPHVQMIVRAAVQTQKSNKMMDLKDKADFYKTVENLIVATCAELKVAPPQPNSLNEQMLLFVATGASLYWGVQWVYSNDPIVRAEFRRLKDVVESMKVGDKIPGVDAAGAPKDYPLLTESRHVPPKQSAKAPTSVAIRPYEDVY